MKVYAIEHVQLAMPPNGEETARSFYTGVFGLIEKPKPPRLAARGGVWFEQGDLKIHLGVDSDSHRPRFTARVLGRAAGGAAARGYLRLSGGAQPKRSQSMNRTARAKQSRF